MRRNGGFTLIELMVTLALLAVMAKLAAPPMAQFIQSARLNSAANQLQADLLAARREAIRRNTRVLICPVASLGSTNGLCGTDFTKWATWGWLVCYDVDANDQCDATAVLDPNPIRTHGALDASVTLTGPIAVLRFNANGTQGAAGAASQTFTVTGTWSGAKTYTETIAATGNVAMVKPS